MSKVELVYECNGQRYTTRGGDTITFQLPVHVTPDNFGGSSRIARDFYIPVEVTVEVVAVRKRKTHPRHLPPCDLCEERR